jgi:(2Fe-2S) ferredoxin
LLSEEAKKPELSIDGRCVLVCQNIACRDRGALKVLETFRSYSLTNWTVRNSGCLGQCGNGPMVLILPEQIWYDRISPEQVDLIVKQHLERGQPVQELLYREFHPIHENKRSPEDRYTIASIFIVSSIAFTLIVIFWLTHIF